MPPSRGRGAPEQTTCANGLRASRAVAGQAAGLARGPLFTQGVRREHEKSAAPIDRGREMPTRKMASAPEASAPARACTARGRGAGAPARGAAERREGSAHSAPLRSVAICRVEVGLPTFRSNRPGRSEPPQHAPLLPAVPTTRLGPSARRRAMAQESGTLVDHACRPVVWTHSLPSMASATLGYRV